MGPDLSAFIDDVGRIVDSSDDQYVITEQVPRRLSAFLAGDFELPQQLTRPSPDRHLNYPLHIAPTVGSHVYGGNLGVTSRQAYDPATGDVEWFVSGWDGSHGDSAHG